MNQKIYIFLFLLLSVFAKTQDSTSLAITQTIAKQDSNLYCEPLATFSASPNQNYGFDAYNPLYEPILNDGKYQTLDFANGSKYIVPWKLVESYKQDYVVVKSTNKQVYYKTDLGIPLQPNANNEIQIRGTTNGDLRAIYAYIKQDSTEKIVGKLNVLSMDELPKTVYLVGLNGFKISDAVKQGISDIYSKSLINLEVKTSDLQCDDFDRNGDGMLQHGSTTVVTVYNSEQSALIKALKEKSGYDENAGYLIFTDKYTGNTGATGYMPINHQVGFIYKNPTAKAVAHELGHGMFNLYHPFSQYEAIKEQTTQNLMDYNSGTDLLQYQWTLVHNPQTMILTNALDDKESEFDPKEHKKIFTDLLETCDIDDNFKEIVIKGLLDADYKGWFEEFHFDNCKGCENNEWNDVDLTKCGYLLIKEKYLGLSKTITELYGLLLDSYKNKEIGEPKSSIINNVSFKNLGGKWNFTETYEYYLYWYGVLLHNMQDFYAHSNYAEIVMQYETENNLVFNNTFGEVINDENSFSDFIKLLKRNGTDKNGRYLGLYTGNWDLITYIIKDKLGLIENKDPNSHYKTNKDFDPKEKPDYYKNDAKRKEGAKKAFDIASQVTVKFIKKIENIKK